MRVRPQSYVNWNNIALCGGVDAVARRAVNEGLLIQLMCEDKPVAEAPIQRVFCTYTEYGYGAILDAPDTVWKDVTVGPTTSADLWFENFGRGHPLFRNHFGGPMSVVNGTLTVVWNTEGIADFGDVYLYHCALEAFGNVRSDEEVFEETIESLRGIYATIENM